MSKTSLFTWCFSTYASNNKPVNFFNPIGRRSCKIKMEEKTLLLHENVCFQMLDFVTSKSNSEVAKSNSNTFVENHFFLINYIKWGSRFSQCFILLTALHYLLPSNVYMLTIILRKVSNAFKAVCGIADWYNRNQCWYHHDSALVLHISLGKWHAFKLLQRADSTNPYAVNN